MRDYRGTRRISAPSVFLAEMTGSETVVSGDEAPAAGSRASFDPFGDAARSARGNFDEYAQDVVAGQPLRVFRPDGLTLEGDEAQEPIVLPSRAARRRPEAALERASDLAARMTGRASGGPGADARSFEQGQRVRHAEYGEGVLAKITGVGPRSLGTVVFDGPAGTRKFILCHGGLELVD
jgi:hypothetical protein